MTLVRKFAPALIGVGAVIISYLYCGQDVESTEDFLIANLGTILLAVQIVVIFIMAVTKNYVSGAILICTSIITIILQRMVI